MSGVQGGSKAFPALLAYDPSRRMTRNLDRLDSWWLPVEAYGVIIYQLSFIVLYQFRFQPDTNLGMGQYTVPDFRCLKTSIPAILGAPRTSPLPLRHFDDSAFEVFLVERSRHVVVLDKKSHHHSGRQAFLTCTCVGPLDLKLQGWLSAWLLC